jgi:hypothetical protein
LGLYEYAAPDIKWGKIRDLGLKNLTFLGKEANFNEVDQGYLGDCYFLAGCAALAENFYRLTNNMITKTIST